MTPTTSINYDLINTVDDLLLHCKRDNGEWKRAHVISELAKRNKLSLIQYAVDHGCYLDSLAVNWAIFHKSYECLTYLLPIYLQRGLPSMFFAWEFSDDHTQMSNVPSNIISAAVMSGYLPSVQFVRSMGFTWNEHSFSLAALTSNIELLQYMYDDKCPWSHDTTLVAVNLTSADALKFCLDHGCPYHPNTTYMAFRLCLSFDVIKVCVEYLLQHQLNFDITRAANEVILCLKKYKEEVSFLTFRYLLSLALNKQEFWRTDYDCVLHYADFDDDVWRCVLNFDINTFSTEAQQLILDKRQELQNLYDVTKYLVGDYVPQNVVQFIINKIY